jgi:DNA-binding response OmpR family regulator
LLASKPGKVFKDEILDKVWGKEVVGGRTIDVY